MHNKQGWRHPGLPEGAGSGAGQPPCGRHDGTVGISFRD
jgi:hypothetical protein